MIEVRCRSIIGPDARGGWVSGLDARMSFAGRQKASNRWKVVGGSLTGFSEQQREAICAYLKGVRAIPSTLQGISSSMKQRRSGLRPLGSDPATSSRRVGGSTTCIQRNHGQGQWCPGKDSNLHGREATGT